MKDFLYEEVINSMSTTYDEAKIAHNKTPIDFENLDPFEVDDLRDGVFDQNLYITERDRW